MHESLMGWVVPGAMETSNRLGGDLSGLIVTPRHLCATVRRAAGHSCDVGPFGSSWRVVPRIEPSAANTRSRSTPRSNSPTGRMRIRPARR